MEVKGRYIFGSFIILINLLWIWEQIDSFYIYHYTELMVFFELPDWLLLINTIFGVVGIWIGIKFMQGAFSIWKIFLTEVVLITLGALIHVLVLNPGIFL